MTAILLTLAVLVLPVHADDAPTQVSVLRLIPFPREVRLQGRDFPLSKRLVLCTTNDLRTPAWRKQLVEETMRLGCEVRIRTWRDAPPKTHAFALITEGSKSPPSSLPKPPEQEEGYTLRVDDDGVVATAADAAGLCWAAQTVRQLLRANVRAGALAGLLIRDWPALRWRGFQDDLTRGPSTKLDVLKREVELGALAKLNFFTYYMEHQFAHPKHPEIGPPDGSLSAEELSALTAHARRLGVDIVGCQQSFGHFYHILKHDRYQALRETPSILCPVNEESYRLLDDLYSDQMPHTSSLFFNVCCDETYGLGQGPSRELAEKIGVGGVYARHIRRIHDLVTKHGKRMMMWGDIILQHPEHLTEIPKDVIMLTWGYSPRPSFRKQIDPFVHSGYSFFVCPGVSCWSSQLPDFAAAAVNIRNFVRDGVKQGAMGMLNTAWDDDGENLQSLNWPGFLWGAECAWTGSTTDLSDFHRRLGAVLFGERGDHFGQAIELLSRLHALPGYDRLLDRRFWRLDLGDVPSTIAAERSRAQQLAGIVRLALTHLRMVQSDARVNADLLDYFIFGAERVQLMATRRLNFLRAAELYDAALHASTAFELQRATARPARRDETARQVAERALALMRFIRQQHLDLRQRYVALWRRENKPYALDRVLARFDNAVASYASIVKRLEQALASVDRGEHLPSAETVGLLVQETGIRSPHPILAPTPMDAEIPWSAPASRWRCGIEVAAGNVARYDAPIEIDVPASPQTGGAVRLFRLAGGHQVEIPCQLDQLLDDGGARVMRITALIPGEVAAGQRARLLLYQSDKKATPKPSSLRYRQTTAGYWIEHRLLRAFLGWEGAHLYHWIVGPPPAQSTDLTHPGDTGYFGFADIGGVHRSARNRIEVVQAGAVLVRLRCRDELGLARTLSFFAGRPWVEVVIDPPTGLFWNFDDSRLFGGELERAATYLFSDGTTGRVGKVAAGLAAQVRRPRTRWSAKLSPRGFMLALVTPEVAARHCIGPGGGWGGVGIESSPPVGHFVIYGGSAPDNPAAALNRLRHTLDFTNQMRVKVFAWESREMG